MYIQRQVLAPAPVIQTIKPRLHKCNVHHQPSVRPANIAYLQGEENQPHTSCTESCAASALERTAALIIEGKHAPRRRRSAWAAVPCAWSWERRLRSLSLVGSVGGRQVEERTFTPSVMCSPMYLCTFVTSKPAKPCPLSQYSQTTPWGVHGHIPRPHIHPISLYICGYMHTRIHTNKQMSI